MTSTTAKRRTQTGSVRISGEQAATIERVREAEGLANTSEVVRWLVNEETKRRRKKPISKWRCSRCWAKLPRPRAEKIPNCDECRVGQKTLFGEEAQLPEGAVPLTAESEVRFPQCKRPRRRRRST